MYAQWFRYSKDWYTAPHGFVEPAESDFKREVERLSGRNYRPHVFKNCIFNVQNDKEIHILWAKPPTRNR